MYNIETEIITPSSVILNLRGLRGSQWQKLVDSISIMEPETIDCTAFILMMARMNGCISCNSDSFRAMKGCTQCTRHSIHRYHGDDQELIDLYQQTYQEVERYLDSTSPLGGLESLENNRT